MASCSVENVVHKFLVDTGSAASILSTNVFMNLKNRPTLVETDLTLTAADGGNLNVLGTVDLQFSLENGSFCHEFVVAEVDDLEGILGMDFLEQHNVTIQVAQGVLMFADQQLVRLEKDYTSLCTRVKLSKKVVIPPDSEVIVPAYAVGVKDTSIKNLVEPFQFLQKKGLLVARTLVNPENIQFSVANISDKPIKFDKHTTVASLQPVNIVQSNPDCEFVVDESTELPEHLHSLYDRSSKCLTQEQKSTLFDLLVSYKDIFVGPDGKFGRTKLVKHKIDTGDHKPIKIPPRRLPVAQREIVENEIQKMLDNNIIEPSESPWSAPLLLVEKKDKTWRFCVDYRQLNKVTKKDAYPLPRIDESLDALTGASWFCTLDLVSGYWQCEMEKEDKAKTAFSTHMGLFQFQVLPFGISNAPSCYERLMELVLRGLRWEKCLCYLDDIIVFGSSFEQTVENLKTVFDRLESANLTLKSSKCDLFQQKVSFLGHIVSNQGIQCDPEKINSIASWPDPKNATEVRSFLGLAGYYRRFIPDFSTVASPLTNLTRKRTKYVWTPVHQAAFNKLKQLLTTAPILAYPDNHSEFILDTDASNTGIGAVLSQIQNGEERVVAYASRTLNKHQIKYCTTYKELLAVITFIRQYRHFLWGRHFTVRTDHASLIWLKNFKNPEGMLARWLSILETYDFQIVHRPGRLHSNADSLSRRPASYCKRQDCPDCHGKDQCHKGATANHKGSHTESESVRVAPIRASSESVSDDDTDATSDSFPDNDTNWLHGWTHDELKNMQQAEPAIRDILRLKEVFITKPPRHTVLDASQDLKTLWGLWESLTVVNNILYYKWKMPNNREVLLLVAPREIRSTILQQLHNNRTAGHLGRERTLRSIKRRVYWPGMSSDVKRWCAQCDTCARVKNGPGVGKSSLCQSVTGAPLDRIGIDIVGPLPVTNDGNEYIIVLCDYFTKWVEAYAVPDHQALTVGDKIVTEFICTFGVPRQIHTDQGREFESELFLTLCQKLGIEKTRTTPYRPQSDGLVERFNRTLQQMLTSYANDNRNNWDENLPYVLMAYRSSIQESTGCSPNMLMFGRENNSPIDLIIGNPPDNPNPICPREYVEWLKNVLTDTHDFVHRNLEQAATKQKKYYDRGLKPRAFSKDDFVWRWYPPTAGIKLGLGWTGPYKVIDKITEVTYRIKKTPESSCIVVHVDHLKPYEGVSPPVSWIQEVSSLEDTNSELENIHVDDESMSDDESVLSPLRNNSPVIKRSRVGRAIKPRDIYSP